MQNRREHFDSWRAKSTGFPTLRGSLPAGNQGEAVLRYATTSVKDIRHVVGQDVKDGSHKYKAPNVSPPVTSSAIRKFDLPKLVAYCILTRCGSPRGHTVDSDLS